MGSVAGLAGCSGDNDGGDGGDGSDGDGGDGGDGDGNSTPTDEPMVDKWWTTRVSTNPADVTWNNYQGNGDWYINSLMHGFGAKLARRTPLTWVPLLFKNWELDGTTYTFELNENFHWHDGKNVTADDIAFQYEWVSDQRMASGKNRPALDYTAEGEDGWPTAVDDYTLEFELAEEANPDVLVADFLGEPYWYPPQLYGEYNEELAAATTDEEREDIRVKVAEEVTFDAPIGFGPLKYVEHNNRTVTMEFFDDYPWEDVQEQLVNAIGEENMDVDPRGWGQPNYNGIRAKFVADNNTMQQEIRSGSIDGGVSPYIPPDQRPDGMHTPLLPILHGQGIHFNFWDWGPEPGDPLLTDINVRKALAHAIDRQASGIQFAQGVEDAPLDSLMTGMLQGQEESWLSDDFKGQLDDYEHDYDAAAAYMEEAGFSMKNGTWNTPEGENWQPVMKTGAGVTRYVNGFEVISSNLNEAGIDVQVELEENSTFFGKGDNESGMDITTTYWGGASANPYFAFYWQYLRESESPEGGEERDYYLPGNGVEGEDEVMEVPEIGDHDGDRSVTVDPAEELEALRSSTDENEQQEIVERLAWATNWWVPKITCNENFLTGALNTNGWRMPDPENSTEMSINPHYNMPFHFGLIRADQ